MTTKELPSFVDNTLNKAVQYLMLHQLRQRGYRYITKDSIDDTVTAHKDEPSLEYVYPSKPCNDRMRWSSPSFTVNLEALVELLDMFDELDTFQVYTVQELMDSLE